MRHRKGSMEKTLQARPLATAVLGTFTAEIYVCTGDFKPSSVSHSRSGWRFSTPILCRKVHRYLGSFAIWRL